MQDAAASCSRTVLHQPKDRMGSIGLVWSLQPLNAIHRRQASLFPFPSQQYIPWPAIYERQLPLVDVILQLLCPIRLVLGNTAGATKNHDI
jgi:hypothetical protein